MLTRRLSSPSPVIAAHRRIDDIFDSLFTSFGGFNGSNIESGDRETVHPPLCIWQNDEAVHIRVDLPGFKMDDLEVTYLENRLTIRGQRNEEELPENVQYIWREPKVSEFKRTVSLPVEVDPAGIEAQLDAGVLRIIMKKAQAALPRKIQITTDEA